MEGEGDLERRVRESLDFIFDDSISLERLSELDEPAGQTPLNAYRVKNPERNDAAVAMIVWIDEANRVHRIEHRSLRGNDRRLAEAPSVVSTHVRYAIPLDAALFGPDFGPGIKVVNEHPFEELTDLASASFKEDVEGVMLAVHQATRLETGANACLYLASPLAADSATRRGAAVGALTFELEATKRAGVVTLPLAVVRVGKIEAV